MTQSHGAFVYVIKQLDLALRPVYAEACATQGLTLAQYTALTVLQNRPGISSAELARRSLVRAQTMATTLNPLLDAGLIRRESDPNHLRRRLLYLTDHGMEIIAALAPQIDALEELLVSDLSEGERLLFRDYLRRARNAMHAAGDRTTRDSEPPAEAAAE